MDAAVYQTSCSLSPSPFNPTKAERTMKRREWSQEKGAPLQPKEKYSSAEEEQEVKELEERIRLAEENKMKSVETFRRVRFLANVACF